MAKSILNLLAIFWLTSCTLAGWLGETRVNVETEGKQASRGSDCPWSLACGPDGKVHVVWEDRREGRELRIFYRGKTPSPTWDVWDSTDANISQVDSVPLFGHPSIGALDNGSILSVYVEERPLGGELYGTIWPAGFASWNEPEFISLPGGNRLTFTSMGWQTTMATNGHRAITFWPYVSDSLYGYRPIYYRRYDQAGWESCEWPLELPSLGLQYEAKNLSAIWAVTDTVYLVFAAMTSELPVYNIYFIKFDFIQNQVCGFEQITNNPAMSAEYPYLARVPAPEGDDIYISYCQNGDTTKAKLAYLRHDQGAWNCGIDIDIESSAFPCLAYNPHDWIDIVYEKPANQPNTQIYHRRYYQKTNQFTEPERISQGDYFSKRPVVACDKFGNVHVTYISNREHPNVQGDEEVFYRMFDSPPLQPLNVFVDGDTLRWDYPDLPDFRIFVVFNVGAETTMIGSTRNRYFRHSLGPTAILGVRALDLAYQASPLAVSQRPTDIGEISQSAVIFNAGENYPNPFNQTTIIPIVSKGMGPIAIEIYDICGRLLRQLHANMDDDRVVWDGKNSFGWDVPSGVYFYRAIQGGSIIRRKMTLIR